MTLNAIIFSYQLDVVMMNDHRYRSNEIPDYEELNGGGADDQSD